MDVGYNRYAAGATIQVLLFSVLAVEIKRKCPAIHTVLEIVGARWGTTAHLVFLFFCIATNLIVTAMLILGGVSFFSCGNTMMCTDVTNMTQFVRDVCTHTTNIYLHIRKYMQVLLL